MPHPSNQAATELRFAATGGYQVVRFEHLADANASESRLLKTYRGSLPAFAIMLALIAGIAWGDDERRSWDLSVGVGAAAMPRYSGASAASPRLRMWVDGEYRLASLGTLALDSGSLTIDPELRWNVVDRPDAGLGPLVGYRFGRTDKNPGFTSSSDGSARLQGLPDVGSTVDAGVQGHVLVSGIPLFAQLRSALSGAQGTLANVGLYLPLWPGRTFSLTVLPTAKWANAKQMRALFGVSPEASAASGFAVYEPKAGWESAALEVVGECRSSGSWRLVGSIAYERLLDEAAHSPIVQSRNQVSVLGGVIWSF